MADLYGARAGRDILFGPKVIPVALDAEWREEDHPRGQPGNAGQFGPGGGGGSASSTGKGASSPASSPGGGARAQVHPEVRQHQDKVMGELAKAFPRVAPHVVYEARNNPTYDPWDDTIKLPSYGKDRPLADVDRETDAANPPGYVITAGLRGTLVHEYGHAIDHHIIKHASEELKDAWFDKKRELAAELGETSTYGGSKTWEWLPERFTAEVLGQEPKVLIPVLHEFLAKVHGEESPDVSRETSFGAEPSPVPAATFSERAETLGASQIAWTTSQKKNAQLAAAALNAAGFQAMTENPSGSKADSRFAAIGSPTNGILVNPRSAFWKDPEAAAKHNHAIGHLSSPHPLGVLLHEIAHTQYPDVQAYWMADSQKAVAEKVSRYARTNPREFVSETFAGLHSGLSYDDDVMRLYQLFTRTTPEAPSPEPMPKLPPVAHESWAKQDHIAIKQMAAKIEETIRRDRPDLHDALIERYPMRLLQHALDTLWSTRMQESGSGKGGTLTAADQRLNDVIRGEISRRVEISHSAREKRAVAYSYMSDEEVSHATRVHFSGDSRMKPGLKRQLGLLPPSHLKAIAEMGGAVNAVSEIPALSPDHPYAPGMIPAGLYEPSLRRISVGDQISFPDGGRRMLGSRAHTLRHEVGHAIDDVTVGRMSGDPDFMSAVKQGIERMTPGEKDVAAYWLGETADSHVAKIVARQAETFAEIYAYAYNDGAEHDEEEGVAFGGLSGSRLFEIFGPAKKIMREKLDNFFKDELGFSTSGGANV